MPFQSFKCYLIFLQHWHTESQFFPLKNTWHSGSIWECVLVEYSGSPQGFCGSKNILTVKRFTLTFLQIDCCHLDGLCQHLVFLQYLS